jgi:Tfp pilus assembly PilM family ATPase
VRAFAAGLARAAARGYLARGTEEFIGMEAERTSTRWARLRSHAGRQLWSLATLPVSPEDSRTDARADQHDRAALKRLGGSGRPVVCAVTSPGIDIFPLEFRAADAGSVESLVVSHAQRQISRPLEELVLDYSPLPESVRRPNEDTVAVLVYSAPRRLVDSVLREIDRLGLEAERFITPACALAPHLADGEAGARHLLIHTAMEATSVSVVQQAHVLLERILPWGVRRLSGRLAAALDLEESRCEGFLTPDPSRHDPSGPESPPEQDARPIDSLVTEVLAPAFQELAREAATSLDYCDSVLRHVPTAGVVLVGPLASHADFRKILRTELNLPIRGLEDGMRLHGLEKEPEGVSYAAAAGCALWSDPEPA